MMVPDYNKIVWFYDQLAILVFGRKLEKAKCTYLNQIPHGAKVLVVGGGTGKIIDYLVQLNKQVSIDFVEPSSRMLLKAKKRMSIETKVNFYNCCIQDFGKIGYDTVITNFFFDQFTASHAQQILLHLKSKFNNNGLILFSDFVNSNHYWKKIINHIMYVFFRLTTNIEAAGFPPYDQVFLAAGFYKSATTKVTRNIVATIYAIVPPE